MKISELREILESLEKEGMGNHEAVLVESDGELTPIENICQTEGFYVVAFLGMEEEDCWEITTNLLEACRAGLRALEEISVEQNINYISDTLMLKEAITKAERMEK